MSCATILRWWKKTEKVKVDDQVVLNASIWLIRAIFLRLRVFTEYCKYSKKILKLQFATLSLVKKLNLMFLSEFTLIKKQKPKQKPAQEPCLLLNKKVFSLFLSWKCISILEWIFFVTISAVWCSFSPLHPAA